MLTCTIQVPSSIQYLGLGVRSHKDNVDGTFFPSHQQDQYSPWQASGGDAQAFCGSTVCNLEYGTVWVNGVQMTLANNVAQIYTWTNDANFSHVGSKVTCTGTGLACGDYSKLGNLWVAYIGG